MRRAIAYYRVSTQRQGRSGLGIEAQRAAVARFAEAAGIVLLQELTEGETGKGADAIDRRPHHLVTKQHFFRIPYGDTIPSGNSHFHICLHPTEDHANCFFAPPDGF